MFLKTSNSDIVLKAIELSDAKAIAKMANNRKIWLNMRDRFPHPYHEQHAIDFITMVNESLSDHVFVTLFRGSIVGLVGLHSQEDVYKHSVELGYFVDEFYWNKGIASVAVKTALNFGFETLDLHRIYASVFENNEASMRVLEKCGFIKEGVRKQAVFKDGKYLDEHCYGVLKDFRCKT